MSHLNHFLTARSGVILTGAGGRAAGAAPGRARQSRQHGSVRGLLQPGHRRRPGVATVPPSSSTSGPRLSASSWDRWSRRWPAANSGHGQDPLPWSASSWGCLSRRRGAGVLGCPWRAYLRSAAGTGNAIAGILGLTCRGGIGVLFLRQGFSLGRSAAPLRGGGWVMPAVMVGLLLLLLVAPQMGRDAAGAPTGPIFFSAKGRPASTLRSSSRWRSACMIGVLASGAASAPWGASAT